MEQKSVIIICVSVIICVAILSATALIINNNQISNDNNTTNETNITLNDTNNTTTEQTTNKSTQSTTKQESKVREEDQITPDGWNPKEHEIGREQVGDGRERVYYDDGYSRLVDENGKILSYGY